MQFRLREYCVGIATVFLYPVGDSRIDVHQSAFYSVKSLFRNTATAPIYSVSPFGKAMQMATPQALVIILHTLSGLAAD